MPEPERPSKVLTFPLGVNNVAPDDDLPDGSLRTLVNLDVTSAGKVRTRQGSTSSISLPGAHSLWSAHPYLEAFAVADAVLYRITTALDAIALTTLSSNEPMFYTSWDGETYYSNGTDFGRIREGVRYEWGVEQPLLAPALADSGTYFGCVTFVAGKQESAPSWISNQGGRHFTVIPQPQDSNVTAIRLYLGLPAASDKQAGMVFYLAGQVAVGTTSAWVGEPEGETLKTLLLHRVSPGLNLLYWHGRFYWTTLNRVEYSEPQPHTDLYNPLNAVAPTADAVQLLAAVADGLFVADRQNTWFHAGEDANEMVSRRVWPYGAQSTHRNIPANAFKQNPVPADEYPVWWDTNGVLVRGMPGGLIEPITEGRLSLPVYERATLLFRDQDSIKQLVTLFSAPRGNRNTGFAKERFTHQVIDH